MSNNPFGRVSSPTRTTTNNPFILDADPNDPRNRFPKLDSTGQNFAPQSSGNGLHTPQQQPQQPYNFGDQQPYGNNRSVSQYGNEVPSYLNAQPTGSGFRASSAFGQQLESYYGPGPAQTGVIGGAAQQTSNPSYQTVADFDPYSSLSQLPWAQPVQSSQPTPASATPASPRTASFGGPSFHRDHPRSYVREHKAELEKWDSFSWKQFLQSVEKLKDAWAARKSLVMKAMEEYNQRWTQEDIARCQSLMHEADENIDTITASEFQLQEVESGYRHSADRSSKNRVREALNAGLRSLPEWPEDLQTSPGVTVGYGLDSQGQFTQVAQGQYSQPSQFAQQPPLHQPQYIQAQNQFGYQAQPSFGYGQQQPMYTGWNGPSQFSW